MSQEEFEKFVFPLTENQKRIVKECHHFFSRLRGVHCQRQYGVPFYHGNSWLFYINPHRDGYVELCFPRAKYFSKGIEDLHFGGRQQIGSIDIKTVQQLTSPIFTSLVFEAIRIDAELEFKAIQHATADDATSKVA